MEIIIELIQLALGTRDNLSVAPTVSEWDAIIREASQQGLVGIVYVGVQKIMRHPGCTLTKQQLLLFSGYAIKMKERNIRVSSQGERVLRHFQEAGFQLILLKGQSHLSNYPDYLRGLRAPGDIDIWVKGECIKDVYQFVKKDFPEVEYTYLHIHYPVFAETLVEIHYRPSYLFNPFYNHRLQKWFDRIDLKELEDVTKFRSFNAIFQPLHLYRHLAWEGVSLRQLLDYYFLLKQNPEVDEGELKRLGILKFQKDLIAVSLYLFENTPLSSSSAKILLDDILVTGKLGRKPITRIRYRILHLSKSYSKDILWVPFAQLHHKLWHFWYGFLG